MLREQLGLLERLLKRGTEHGAQTYHRLRSDSACASRTVLHALGAVHGRADALFLAPGPYRLAKRGNGAACSPSFPLPEHTTKSSLEGMICTRLYEHRRSLGRRATKNNTCHRGHVRRREGHTLLSRSRCG